MATVFSGIKDDLYLALRKNHATYDLRTTNSTPRVKWSHGGFDVIKPPMVLIGGLDAKCEYSPASLGFYQITYALEWWAFAPVDAMDPETRVTSALDLVNDLMKAVHDAHHDPATYVTLGGCTEVLVSLDEVFGDGEDMPTGMAMATGKIRIVRVDMAGGV